MKITPNDTFNLKKLPIELINLKLMKLKFMHRNLNNFLKIFKYSSIFNNNVIILFDIESKFLLIKRTINIYCKNNLEFFYF